MSPAFLIVNADDFGYFRCVSRGIVEAARAGSVTATGVMANGSGLEDSLQSLASTDPPPDLGVHLNLTWGPPLTAGLADGYARGGRFPTKFGLLRALLRRRLTQELVRAEWRAQIERCLALGVQPTFLNSHEHVHMLPGLNVLARELADAYGIAHVRHVTPEATVSPGGLVRSAAVAALARMSRPTSVPVTLLGLSISGRLDVGYLQRRLTSLEHGRVYELMCHPGRLDRSEIRDRRLLAYHRWEDELEALVGGTFRRICEENGIELIGYRDLPDGATSARTAETRGA